MSFHCPYCRKMIYTATFRPIKLSSGKNFPYRKLLGVTASSFILGLLKANPALTNEDLAFQLASAIRSRGGDISATKSKHTVNNVMDNYYRKKNRKAK